MCAVLSHPHLNTDLQAPPAEPWTDVVALAKAVGDQLRANILKVLRQDSYGVLELCAIFEVAQPAMSHHLKKLSAAGLVKKRREGTSVFYQRVSALGEPLLEAIFQALDAQPQDPAMQSGINQVHLQRVEQSRHFFAHQADALAQQTTLICAPEVYTASVVDLIQTQPQHQRQHALEVGPGDGALLTALAPLFDQVTGLDNAAEMLQKSAAAVSAWSNVTLTQADFTELPNQPQYNLIAAAMVVHHLPSPPSFFVQAARLLQPGGLLVIAELCDHNQEWVKTACADVWLGFEPEQLSLWAAQAGLAQTQQQFLAQRNGFRVQVSAFTPLPDTPVHQAE